MVGNQTNLRHILVRLEHAHRPNLEALRSATALGVAELHGYELRWHKRSQDGSGKCDVMKANAPSAVVYQPVDEVGTGHKRPGLIL